MTKAMEQQLRDHATTDHDCPQCGPQDGISFWVHATVTGPVLIPPPCGQESCGGADVSPKTYQCNQCGRMSPRRNFCPPCRAERDRALKRRRYWLAVSRGERPAANAERGYGAEHRALRKRLARLVQAGQATCWRCGRWIAPGEPWDLGHDDVDRSVYRGPEHRSCNRRTSGRRKQVAVSMAPRVQGRVSSRSW
jgi:hypothetical protein